MAVQNYTDFLGKKVSFIVPQEFFKTRTEKDIVVHRVTGTISGVLLYDELSDSEFLIYENDEFYSFKSVTFFEVLPNPTSVD